MRYAAKRDANENELVELSEQLGAYWLQAPPLDGWCFHRGKFTPVEIKNREGRNRYTEGQIMFVARCKQIGAPVWTWRDAADVLACLGAKVGA